MQMIWVVEIGDEFEPEFDDLHEDVRTEILALALLLEQFGPQLKRPRADTLNGSRHANMKELRFGAAHGEWRVAFAFDTVTIQLPRHRVAWIRLFWPLLLTTVLNPDSTTAKTASLGRHVLPSLCALCVL